MLHVLSETDKRLAKETRDRRAALGFPPSQIQRPHSSQPVVNEDLSADRAHIEFLLLSMKLPGIDGAKGDVSISEIIRVAARFYDVRVPEMRSLRRTRDIVIPRQVAMWLARELTHDSYPVLARAFGRRDHTSIIYSVQKIDYLRHTDPDLQSQIDQLLSALRSHNPQGDSNADEDKAPA